ncbi:hypothetical protein BX616_005920, partial [Lobosporangium transversale]
MKKYIEDALNSIIEGLTNPQYFKGTQPTHYDFTAYYNSCRKKVADDESASTVIGLELTDEGLESGDKVLESSVEGLEREWTSIFLPRLRKSNIKIFQETATRLEKTWRSQKMARRLERFKNDIDSQMHKVLGKAILGHRATTLQYSNSTLARDFQAYGKSPVRKDFHEEEPRGGKKTRGPDPRHPLTVGAPLLDEGQRDSDLHFPGGPFGPPSSSDSTSERQGQESSSLKLGHWIYEDQDISKKLMRSRTSVVKEHESLQRVNEILETMLEVTEEEKLAPNTCCQSIQSFAVIRAIADLAFTSANEGYLTALNTWKKVQATWQEDDTHGGHWEVLRASIDHLLITSTLWSPMSYTSRKKGNEDSFSQNIVRPFLMGAFGRLSGVRFRGSGDPFTCGNELDKELKFPDFSVTMDCYNASLGEHYLVIAEIKPPSASQAELDDDYIKLSNLMKSALDWQLGQGYDDGAVVGILVQGWRVSVFYIVLEHEAIYELRNIGQFSLVADHTQLAQLLSICPVLLKAK